jgi:ribonuclease HI
MQGKYKVNSPDLRPLWEEARRRAAKLDRFEIAHTLRGGNKEADQLANDAMDRGMGRAPVSSAPSSSAPMSSTSVPSISRPAASTRPAAPVQRQVLEGFVKNGVVHLIEGELPDGIFVKIIRE